MSARPLLTLIDRRADSVPIHVLFVGKRLAKAGNVFKRKDESIKCDHTNSAADAVETITEQARKLPFDCVIVDVRDDDGESPLHVVNMATLGGANLLAVIVRPEDAEMFEGLPGVHRVLIDPVGPKDLISTIIESLPEENEIEEADADEAEMDFVADGVFISRGNEQFSDSQVSDDQGEPDQSSEKVEAVTAELEAVVDVEEAVEFEVGAVEVRKEKTTKKKTKKNKKKNIEKSKQKNKEKNKEKNVVTKGFETSLSKVKEVDRGIWQRFVPLANFVYKKLAIVILTALFLTFMSYGAMIVFFLGSSSWSLPFELSKGHKLVEKVERDLSSMNLRRNDLQQTMTIATVDKEAALRDKSDGELQLMLNKRTIESEILLQKEEVTTIDLQISRFQQVITDFKSLNGKNKFSKNLTQAYKKRLITKKALASGTLALLETTHRIAALQNDISMKKLDQHRVERRLAFLESLLKEVDQPQIRVITSPSSELAHLAREAIEAKNRISKSKLAVAAAEKRLARLNNSLELISANIASIEATPMARALHKPVTVLFVPYSNAENVYEGQPLYRCAVTIVWCSKIGEVGAKVDGETTGVHPLFGKPLRGTFVEAKFTNPKFATENLIHAGRPPLRF